MLTKSFVTAGRASFVVANPQGESVTVKVSKGRPKLGRNGQPMSPKMWVSLRHNNNPWQWVGSLDVDKGEILVASPTAQYNRATAVDARVVTIANWALKCVWENLAVPAGYRLEHTGRCGRCGKMLRDADSIKSGFGPECIKYV